MPLWKKAMEPGLLSDADKKALCRQIEYILPAKAGKFANVTYSAKYTDNPRDDVIEVTATDKLPDGKTKPLYKFTIKVINPTPATVRSSYRPAGAYHYRAEQDRYYTILAGRVEVTVTPLAREVSLDSELRRTAYSFKLQELLNF